MMSTLFIEKKIKKNISANTGRAFSELHHLPPHSGLIASWNLWGESQAPEDDKIDFANHQTHKRTNSKEFSNRHG
jgi:hypothetical protein